MDLDVFKKNKVMFEQKIAQAMSRMRIPGLTIAMIKDNQVIYRRGFGTKDLENNVPKKHPITPDTKLEMSSCTKSFTALAIMQLYEQGKLNVNDPVKKHLKWFQLGFPDNPITIHHLLTHSSGIPGLHGFWSTVRLRDFNQEDAPPMVPFSSKEDIILFINSAQNEVLFRPGEKYLYFNMGYSLLGMIIKEVSGEEYEDYIHKHILNPLNMKTSFFPSEEPVEGIFDISVNYEMRGKQLVRAQRNVDQFFNPPGGLISSVNEVSNYLIALMNEGKFEEQQIISPESIQKIIYPHQKVGMFIRSRLSLVSGLDYYGYGWIIRKNFFEYDLIEHRGGTGAASAQIFMVPEKKIGLVAVTNKPGGYKLELAYLMGLMTLLGKDPMTDTDYFKKESILDKLVGEYSKFQDFIKISIRRAPTGVLVLFVPYPKNPGLLVPVESDPERLTYFLYTDFDFKTKVQFLNFKPIIA